MRVRITMDWDENARRALARHHGRDGLAPRDEIEGWMYAVLRAASEDLPDPNPDPED